MNSGIITLTTDFGLKDSYVASMKGAILSVSPGACLVDVSHLIPPQDIRSGAFVLGQVFDDFPVGTVHVAVVDPGVGTSRRGLAVEAGGSYLVGPDNGLFSRVLTRVVCGEARSLENPEYWRHKVARTFHGRDVFALVAAHLVNGVALGALGPRCTPFIASWARPKEEKDELTGEVIYVDHFGNAITNIHKHDLERFASPSQWHVRVGGDAVAGVVETYGKAIPGAIIALIGSSDHLEIAVNQGDAARTLSIQPGSPIAVQRRS